MCLSTTWSSPAKERPCRFHHHVRSFPPWARPSPPHQHVHCARPVSPWTRPTLSTSSHCSSIKKPIRMTARGELHLEFDHRYFPPRPVPTLSSPNAAATAHGQPCYGLAQRQRRPRTCAARRGPSNTNAACSPEQPHRGLVQEPPSTTVRSLSSSHSARPAARPPQSCHTSRSARPASPWTQPPQSRSHRHHHRAWATPPRAHPHQPSTMDSPASTSPPPQAVPNTKQHPRSQRPAPSNTLTPASALVPPSPPREASSVVSSTIAHHHEIPAQPCARSPLDHEREASLAMGSAAVIPRHPSHHARTQHHQPSASPSLGLAATCAHGRPQLLDQHLPRTLVLRPPSPCDISESHGTSAGASRPAGSRKQSM